MKMSLQYQKEKKYETKTPPITHLQKFQLRITSIYKTNLTNSTLTKFEARIT